FNKQGGGTLSVTPLTSSNASTLTVAGGTVNFNGTGTLGTLSMANNTAAHLIAGGQKVLVLNTIDSEGGRLDLHDNDLIVHSMPLTDVEDLVRAGFGNYDWSGTGIMSSSAAATAQVDASTALGVLDNNEWG